MIFFVSTLAIVQSFAISLGVGSSTLAILNFFVAIKDGKIDESERRLMGVGYLVLRIAMVAILLTTLCLMQIQYVYQGAASFSVLEWGQLFTLVVLFLNAGLMTAHMIPSNFGPAIQAGNWYTLGFLAALKPILQVNLSWLQFGLLYLTWIVLTIAAVNLVMAWMKAHRHGMISK